MKNLNKVVSRGRTAYTKGVELGSNPYISLRQQDCYLAWQQGWYEGQMKDSSWRG